MSDRIGPASPPRRLPPARPAPRAGLGARAAVTTVFFVHGLLFASWTAHIPHIQARIGADDGALGIVLLGAPVGSVMAMIAAGYLLPRVGSRGLVRVALAGYCAVGPLVGLVGSLATLFVALMAWGAFQGALDVSMNTQALAVERGRGRPLMPGFHAFWSIGALAGAGLGAGGVAVGLSLSWQLLLAATPCVVVAGWLTLGMIPDRRAPLPRPVSRGGAGVERERARWWGRGGLRGTDRWSAPEGRRLPALQAATLTLGAIAFADMLCEGVAADWSAVYLRNSVGTSAAVAGLGYTGYALAMTSVRLSGNGLLARVGARRLVPALASLATVGMAVGLARGGAVATLVGLACLGAGLAAVVPVAFSAAGRVPGLHPGTAVATVSGFGWAGFVCGPPLIGQLAAATSLRAALVAVPVLTAAVAIAAATARVLHGGGVAPAAAVSVG